MAKVYDSILDLVGKTPLVELKRIEEKEGLQAKLIAKVESFNPAGSQRPYCKSDDRGCGSKRSLKGRLRYH